MNRATITPGITAALVAIMVFIGGCTNAPPESPCTQAAQDAGLPGGVIDQLRNPEGLDAGEWLELNRALGEVGITDACGEVTRQPGGEPEGREDRQDGETADETPVPREAEPPEEPTTSVVPSARVPEEDEDRRRCRFWALNNLQPTVYQEFAKLEPERMDDLDRILWRSILHPHDHLGFYDDDHARGDEIPPLLPGNPGIHCRDYWAEPLGPGNADLRNAGYETQCRQGLEERITSRYSDLASRASHDEDNEAVWKTPNQHVRVLQWLDMSGDELLDAGRPPHILLMEQSRYPYAHMQGHIPDENFLADYRRERDGEVDLEWLGILAAAGMTDNSLDLRECHYFYPQVFYGYWVPVDPGTPPDHGDGRETDLVEYDPSTMPILLPETVDVPRVGAGFPLGMVGEQYHRCSGESEAEAAGYYFVDHPTGAYCERIR